MFTKQSLGKPFAQGMFTKAYNHPDDSSKVVLISCDPIKDCMAHGWFPDARNNGWDTDLYPVIDQIGPCDWMRIPGNWRIYSMDRLERPRSLKKAIPEKDYELFKRLQRFMDDDVFGIVRYRHFTISYLHKVIAESDHLQDWTKDFLIESVSGCANAGCDPTFEISPRNVAVQNGRLVLLDVWLMISELTKSQLRRGV